MTTADIGLVGLGVMGAALALNMADKGHRVAVYNRTTSRSADFMAAAGNLAARLTPCSSLKQLVIALHPPRPIILMIKAGAAVDEQAALLGSRLGGGDILIDAGNANFHDTGRRCAVWAAKDVGFLGVGVSGGEDGARHGPSIMAGGPETAWQRVAHIFTDIAARYRGEACSALLGPGGAGHFVKMIHNGIEYADMQMIAEIYGLLRDGLGLHPKQIGEIFARWNGGRLNSYLIEVTAAVLAADDAKTGEPVVDIIVDRAGQKGTGRWAAVEAQSMGVPATAIEAAVAARSLSAMKIEREHAAAAYATPIARLSPSNGTAIIDQLELALYAGKIAAYAQGFAIMEQASA
ncbi:MAG: NADP-dependent phosphogluconate dehydrogenase, partial [Pseudomonadota bacterium]